MRKIFAFLLLIVIFSFPVAAKTKDYPDPNHPGVRVREFVHETQPLFTCSDNDSTALPKLIGWKLPPSWSYTLNPNNLPAPVVQAAFDEWHRALPPVTIVFKGTTAKTKSAYDKLNIVAFGKAPGTALAVTYTRYNSITKQVVDVDTIFNSRFSWGVANTCGANFYDIQDILTHEIGHWYGLDDEYTSAFVYNTMYGYGSKGEIYKNTLTTGDIVSLQQLAF